MTENVNGGLSARGNRLSQRDAAGCGSWFPHQSGSGARQTWVQKVPADCGCERLLLFWDGARPAALPPAAKTHGSWTFLERQTCQAWLTTCSRLTLTEEIILSAHWWLVAVPLLHPSFSANMCEIKNSKLVRLMHHMTEVPQSLRGRVTVSNDSSSG